jgi:hypothetical protein
MNKTVKKVLARTVATLIETNRVKRALEDFKVACRALEYSAKELNLTDELSDAIKSFTLEESTDFIRTYIMMLKFSQEALTEAAQHCDIEHGCPDCPNRQDCPVLQSAQARHLQVRPVESANN